MLLVLVSAIVCCLCSSLVCGRCSLSVFVAYCLLLNVGRVYVCRVSLVEYVCDCLSLVVVVVCVIVHVWCWCCLTLCWMVVVGDSRGVLFGWCCLLSCCCLFFVVVVMQCVVCVFGCLLQCYVLMFLVRCLMLFDV